MSSDLSAKGGVLQAILNSGRFALPLSHGRALIIVAQLNGFDSWHTAASAGIPTDVMKAQAKRLREALKTVSSPVTCEEATRISTELGLTPPPIKGPKPKHSRLDPVANTPLQVLGSDDYRDPNFGAAPRDFYAIGRICIPARIVMPDGSDFGPGHVYLVQDIAAQAIVGHKILDHAGGEAMAADLKDAVQSAINRFGRPKKGWIVSYSVWWALKDLLDSDNSDLAARARDLQADGATFGRMALSEKRSFEKWLADSGMECSFTEAWCAGEDKVTAKMSEEEFPPAKGLRLERIPGTREFEYDMKPKLPELWKWVEGTKYQVPEEYASLRPLVGMGFASTFRSGATSDAEENKFFFRFHIQHQLSAQTGLTFLVTKEATDVLVKRPLTNTPIDPDFFPAPGIRFLFEEGSLRFDHGELVSLEMAVIRKGAIAEIPPGIVPPQAAHMFRRVQCPYDVVVSSSCFLMTGSRYSWEIREEILHTPFEHARTTIEFANANMTQTKSEGHRSAHLPDPSVELPQTMSLLLQLVEHIKSHSWLLEQAKLKKRSGDEPATVRID